MVPLVDPKWVCHALLERLQLPSPFYTMVDNALTGIYWPNYYKLAGSRVSGIRSKEKRLDVECMSLIVVLVKLVYRLDDVTEL